MKKCEQFKDWILTDYIDGELDKNSSVQLESHLLDCGECRAFFKEVKNNAALPFQQVSRQPVPAELWARIQQDIENKESAVSPLANFIEGLKGMFVLPRLVPIFASLTLMFIIGSVTLNNIQLQQAKNTEQGEYVVSLLSTSGTSSQAVSGDLGTPIEHYFL